MFSTFGLVIITILLVFAWLFHLVSSMAGEPIWPFPFWLTEIMVSYYWFALVYWTLRITLYREKFTTDLQQVLVHRAGNLFWCHLVVAYLLSLGVLPLFLPWPMRIMIAYPGTTLVLVVIPMLFTPSLYKQTMHKKQSDKMRPGKIRTLAMRNTEAQRFVRLFPDYKVFVFDYQAKNRMATCLFLFRRERPERPGLMEDVTLEVKVDMKTRLPHDELTKVSRYLFEIRDDKSAVYHLSEENSLDKQPVDEPLSPQILDRFDTQMNRFPSLEEIPFQLATRNTSYMAIE